MPISQEMAADLQALFEKEGERRGWRDRIDLARKVLGDYISDYEEKNGPLR